MKYENLEKATALCKDIDDLIDHRRMLTDKYFRIHLYGPNKYGNQSVFKYLGGDEESDLASEKIASRFRKSLEELYTSQIDSLYAELEKL